MKTFTKEELQRVLEDHENWLKGMGGSKADLRGADLHNTDLHNADLRGADLRNADLSAAKLSGANLSGVNLSGANLRNADLSESDLFRADLSAAVLSGANLSNASLENCLGNRNEIKSILVLEQYPVTYTADILQIGCEQHTHAEWLEFSDHEIEEMDGPKAVEFWREFKELIFTVMKAAPAKKTQTKAN